MVRAGRRARTLVTSVKGTDVCDSPKRKDQRLDISGKLSNQTITDFFHVVEVVDEIPKIELIENEILPEMNSVVVEQQNTVENLEKSDISAATSTTPHRIELHTELQIQNSPTSALSQLHIAIASKKGQPPKAKRRLNVNQNTNQVLKATVKDETLNNHTLTEYFPVRRSVRKTKKTVLEEKQKTLEQCIRNEIEEGLEVKYFSNKGRGVIASQSFCKGDFVVEYRGELIDIPEAKRREKKYVDDQNTGCYMYYFKHKDIQYCIDATAESGYLGRLVNHCRNGNLLTKSVTVDGIPRLVLIAKDDINSGEEITYDYGDRSKESLLHHPWLAT